MSLTDFYFARQSVGFDLFEFKKWKRKEAKGIYLVLLGYIFGWRRSSYGKV